MSRFDLPCPACGALIKPRGFTWEPTFPCPACGESLRFDGRLTGAIFGVAFLGSPLLAWSFGYQGGKLALVSVGIALLTLVVGIFIKATVILPSYKRVQYDKSKPFDRVVSLRLTNKPDANKKIAP
jgi:hypothetical protein